MLLVGQVIHWAHRITLGIAMWVLVALSLLAFTDVLGRYFLSSPVPGTVELTEVLVALVMFAALAAATHAGEHVKVELLVANSSARTQFLLRKLGEFAVLLACVGIAYGLTEQTFSLLSTGDLTPVLRLPLYPFTLIACLLSLAALLIAVGVLIAIDRPLNSSSPREPND